jgi:hypothetical protein
MSEERKRGEGKWQEASYAGAVVCRLVSYTDYPAICREYPIQAHKTLFYSTQ